MTTWGAEHVCVRFGHTVALDRVSVSAAAGQVTAVVGGDGAGKTTLLRCLAGALAPGEGTVRRPDARRVGYLPSGPGGYEDLSVAENLQFVMRIYGGQGDVGEYLERSGLAAARERLAGQLSGGMRRKLGVIAALLPEPELLVLDEPTTGIDPVSRADLWWLIARAAAGGAAVLMATTYLDEAARAARVLVLDAGRVLAEGTPAEIVAAVPGTIVAVPGPPEDPAERARAWRRAGQWRVWRPPLAVPGWCRTCGTRCAWPRCGASWRRSRMLAECVGVTRTFGAFTAVDGVDLGVAAGEVVGLLGANGAGKTTLIRMLLGLLPPSAGSVRLFSQPPSRAVRRRIGYLPQGLGLYDDLTVAENLAFSGTVYGGARDVPGSLRRYADTCVRDLPLGVTRRVAFAQVLAHSPELLLLDEPTPGVGPLERARLWETIGSAAAGGAGVIVSTHYMEEAEECSRLVVLAAGRVVAAGTAAQIVGDARTVVVASADWAAVLRALDAAGLRTVLAGADPGGADPGGADPGGADPGGPELGGPELGGPDPGGTELRVPGADVGQVSRALTGTAHVRIREEPATLEERFFDLAAAG
jgi:ABC-2 type transport system ATP-binding protein